MLFLSYSPESIELDHCLKPFIPDYIPAVGDIDAFLKVRTPGHVIFIRTVTQRSG